MEKELEIIVGDSLGGPHDQAEGDEVHTDGILKAGSKRPRWSFCRVCGLAVLVFAACAAVVAIHSVKHQTAVVQEVASYSLSNLGQDSSPLPQQKYKDPAGTVSSGSPHNRDLASCYKVSAYSHGYLTGTNAIYGCFNYLNSHGCKLSKCCVTTNGYYYDYWDGTYYCWCTCGTSRYYDYCP